MSYKKLNKKMAITSEGFSRIANGLGMKTEKAPAKKLAQDFSDDAAASELVLWIDNTGSLYPKKQAIYKNLIKKIQQGVYDSQLAAQAFSYLVEEGAKDYFKNFGSSGMKWSDMFSKATRQAAAEEMVNDFEISDEVSELSAAEPASNDIEARIKKALAKSKKAYPLKSWEDTAEELLEDEESVDSLVKHVKPEEHSKNDKKAAKDSPSVYVGTYGKYNSGSIDGKWLNLDDYSSKEEFIDAANALHSDEEDPELMFQDWDGVPDWAIDESFISPAYFELKDRLNSMEQEAFNLFIDHHYGSTFDFAKVEEAIDEFEEAYQGEFTSMTDFAHSIVDDLGMDGIGNAEFYFDSEMFARDLGYDGYEEASESDADSNPDEYPDGPGVYANGEFMGPYDSIEAMVDEWADEGIISDEQKAKYFDYEKFGRDLELGGDFWEEDGHVFRSI